MTNQLINFYEEGRCDLAPDKWDKPVSNVISILTKHFSLLIF